MGTISPNEFLYGIIDLISGDNIDDDNIDKIIDDAGRDTLKAWKKSDRFPNGIWFRGETDKGNPLTPSIFRLNEKGKLIYSSEDERNMFKEANLKVFGDTRFVIDKLCLMQHQGLKTRLLDWSENILAALFFAIDCKKEDEDKDSKLFILNASKLNNIVDNQNNEVNILQPSSYQVVLRANFLRGDCLGAISTTSSEELISTEKASGSSFFNQHYVIDNLKKDPLNYHPEILPDIIQNVIKNSGTCDKMKEYLSKPAAFIPIYRHPRMFSQQSAFTIHGGVNKKDEEGLKKFKKTMGIIEINDGLEGDKEKILIEITISAELKDGIKKRLRDMGIHEGTIYLDEDHQTKQIANFWRRDKD